MDTPVLEINQLSIEIATRHGAVKPVQNVSFAVHPGQVLGIVGESGAGKSLMARAVLKLGGKNVHYTGSIYFEGQNLLNLSDKEMRSIRGRRISMVFQDPMAALNPVLPIGWQLKEVLTTHTGCSAREAARQSIELLEKVRLPRADKVYRQFPFQLSGGMRQRVMIAMAIALKPAVIIADEPTTALDVTVQAQVLAELNRLREEYGIAIILISHDMGVIAEMADRVAVMRRGRIVECDDCFTLFDNPSHDYTKMLLAASSFGSERAGWRGSYGIVTA